ncbi:hypothetical protein CC78DRAFT_578747 [Lojkania enalia]|uniref:Heterokaryon incompatibility domain-containing protein n=1 Tax=Lojkania enalia TaxID=147567 RepID=A0A9P4KC66_9PLEO|nr:hypothetical protein CC78DRAFT_578747 [Didymosphaeria enalia]
MDIIYSQSFLIVVVVDGLDANSGPPGVISGMRPAILPSPSSHQRSFSLSLIGDILDMPWKTRYRSREWTFQELTLSKRLLNARDFGTPKCLYKDQIGGSLTGEGQKEPLCLFKLFLRGFPNLVFVGSGSSSISTAPPSTFDPQNPTRAIAAKKRFLNDRATQLPLDA